LLDLEPVERAAPVVGELPDRIGPGRAIAAAVAARVAGDHAVAPAVAREGVIPEMVVPAETVQEHDRPTRAPLRHLHSNAVGRDRGLTGLLHGGSLLLGPAHLAASRERSGDDAATVPRAPVVVNAAPSPRRGYLRELARGCGRSGVK